MSTLLGKLFGRLNTTSQTMGVGPCWWQPPNVVEPTYEPLEKDRQLWERFERHATQPAAFEGLDTYAQATGEPTASQLKDFEDSVWWSRSQGDLLVLVERDWAGFPDPLAFSLLICDVTDRQLVDLGQFWNLPTAWSVEPRGLRTHGDVKTAESREGSAG